MFGKNWQPGTGKVLDSRVKKVSVTEHGNAITREFVVEVKPSEGAVFRAEVPEGRYADFWHPKIGQSVKVEIDPKSGKVRFDKSDLGLSFKEHQRKAAGAFDATLRGDDA
ncbi:MAG: hypothetical protein JWP10_449 [Nocardioidaceae bacterium]|nr:hypothetical protein [Nocardioidaceae bacterium]